MSDERITKAHALNRYARWAVVLMILAGAFLLGALWDDASKDAERSEVLHDLHEAQAAFVQAQAEFNADLCRAVPVAAVAGAAALEDVIVSENRKRGASEAEIARIHRLGMELRKLARKKTLDDLPECQSKSRPPFSPPKELP